MATVVAGALARGGALPPSEAALAVRSAARWRGAAGRVDPAQSSLARLGGLRIILADSRDGSASLRALDEQGHEIVAVLTRPLHRGKRQETHGPPVASLADQLGLRCEAGKADDELVAQVRALDAESRRWWPPSACSSRSVADAVPAAGSTCISPSAAVAGAAGAAAIWAGRRGERRDGLPDHEAPRAGRLPHLEVPVERGSERRNAGRLAERRSGAGRCHHRCRAGIQPDPSPQRLHDRGEDPACVAQSTGPARPRNRPLVRAVSPDPGAWTMLHGERFKGFTATPRNAHARLAPGELAATPPLWWARGRRLQLTRWRRGPNRWRRRIGRAASRRRLRGGASMAEHHSGGPGGVRSTSPGCPFERCARSRRRRLRQLVTAVLTAACTPRPVRHRSGARHLPPAGQYGTSSRLQPDVHCRACSLPWSTCSGWHASVFRCGYRSLPGGIQRRSRRVAIPSGSPPGQRPSSASCPRRPSFSGATCSRRPETRANWH